MNLVSLDEAVIARYKKGEDHFEILVDPYAAADVIEGKELEISKILAIEAIFTDSKKGTHASEEALYKIFQTNDVTAISKLIILKGEIQITTEQRNKMAKNKRNRIIENIVKNAMDPKTKAPHPRQRIELAMEQAGIHADPFKPVREQIKTTIEALKPILPLSIEQLNISVKIPAEHIGKAYGVVRSFGTLIREDWQSDGSWIGIIRISAGTQTNFYEKINDVTKGNALTKILK